MHRETIDSFEKYLFEISKLSEIPGIMGLFRGQPKKNELLPSIARLNSKKDTTILEKQMLSELKRRTASNSSQNLKDDWDWLVYAQHFGLKTRLLDWTSNPLTAIWFACNNNVDSNAYVYLFLANEKLLLNKEKNPNPFTLTSTKIFRPPQNNERIIAQAGWFTAHAFSKSANKFISLEKSSNYRSDVFEIEIPKKFKLEIVRKCHLFGINHQTMFPNIEGVCRQINWEHYV